MRLWHRRLALGLLLFLAAHLGNHLIGALAGPDAHEAARQWLRQGYGHAVIEALIVTGFAVQIVSGTAMVWRSRALRRSRQAALQAFSGLWTGIFLLIHMLAVMLERLTGGTTDLGFAAAGVQDPLWRWVFLPYYGLALVAMSVHLSIGLPRLWRARPRPGLGAVIGLAMALPVLALMAGLTFPFTAPPFRIWP